MSTLQNTLIQWIFQLNSIEKPKEISRSTLLLHLEKIAKSFYQNNYENFSKLNLESYLIKILQDNQISNSTIENLQEMKDESFFNIVSKIKEIIDFQVSKNSQDSDSEIDENISQKFKKIIFFRMGKEIRERIPKNSKNQILLDSNKSKRRLFRKINLKELQKNTNENNPNNDINTNNNKKKIMKLVRQKKNHKIFEIENEYENENENEQNLGMNNIAKEELKNSKTKHQICKKISKNSK
ncbi:hypothetical protein M0811_07197 [Anaeramoeba ignava]|uniref:Uncharacterized protein n=1 Tax=Anaeramoeba ignava TaxID=1746090 RepID=A0A9Q0RCZ0_ANAIG|nr:hypothetical protein M0811_07197 [Anaeramoeba ignava]